MRNVLDMSKVDIFNISIGNLDHKQYTENKNYILMELEAKIVREVIKTFHYSGKVVSNSKLHLGVFDKKTKKLVGALQYGYPIRDNTPNSIVTGSTRYNMMELNRMAMFDDAPKLSESQAIGLSLKYLKRYKKDIKWVLSYSDGKEGNVGIIYQATNWRYLGYLQAQTFHRLDGEIIHNVSIWHRHKTRKIDFLNTVYDNVSKIVCKQYIYVYPLHDDVVFNLRVEPYPKKGLEPRIIKETIYKENGIVLSPKKVVDYTKLITENSINNTVINKEDAVNE